MHPSLSALVRCQGEAADISSTTSTIKLTERFLSPSPERSEVRQLYQHLETDKAFFESQK